MIAGAICIAVWGASEVVPMIWQAWANRTFERQLQSSARTTPNSPATPNAPGRHSPTPSAPPLETGDLVGRLSIPRLDVSSIVREGDDETTLSLALGHIPGTALPWQNGNVGVAGHRDKLFRALRNIKKDDLIRFETLSGTRVYKVDSTTIVKPRDVGVLASNGRPVLTLVTCYPFYYVGSAPDRFIVSAHQMSSEQGPPPSELVNLAQKSPPPVRPALLKAPAHPAGPSSASFDIVKGQAHEIAPGISLGLTDTDPGKGQVYGWIFLTGEQRSILLRREPVGRPIVVYQDGQKRELEFTSVAEGSARGRLLTIPK